ncbi:MAG: NAD(P)H-binding protein [Caldilineaceae bacterium]|nr:NAD(P)H-binding protein [Caldilineaceae bacterium]
MGESERTNRGKQRILVTGVTGYVGGRLTPRLLEAGYPVRVMVRGGADRLRGRPWRDQVEVVAADVLSPTSLIEALAGVHTAYYLIHSMAGDGAFRARDIQAPPILPAIASLRF